MKKILFPVFLLFIFSTVQAGLLHDITDGKYRAKSIQIPLSMQDGEHYTLMVNQSAVVKYNYKTGQTIDTIFSISRLKNFPAKKINGYQFSPNESKLLIYTQPEYRYRRSYTANYFVVDIKRNEFYPLSENSPQESPLFSPDSRYIAFAHKNNLYMHKLDFKTEIQITKDGEENKIINGIADWVYEEEFEVTRHFHWSPDSKLLAYLKFDEQEVPEFSFQYFSQSGDKDLMLYPKQTTFKYPKAGQQNSKVKVCVYDDFNKTTKVIPFRDDAVEGYYIPRLTWTRSPEELVVFKLNRTQNQLDMYFANPKSGISKLIQRQEDKYYINYELIDQIYFTADKLYYYMMSEKDGYAHIYQYRMNGTPLKQITKGKFDVTDFYGIDETTKNIYFQSAEVSPIHRDIYKINAKGLKIKLSQEKGTHSAYFSNGFQYFTHSFSNIKTPSIFSIDNNLGLKIRSIESNKELTQKVKGLNVSEKKFFEFTTSENISLNGWIIEPVQKVDGKKYPVVMVQYSGPNSQQVLDKWGFDWEYFLAEQGYIVACVDGRGTGARGAEFRKCTYQQMGVLETKDQIEAAKYLGTLPNVDKDRIAIWGWSYGGSMTLWALCSGENVFKAGIAVAPVTDWKLYNTAYTERFMRTPQENFAGYEQTSILKKAANLQGNLLIVHGTADDNVHVQNTLLFTDELVKAGKQFEMQLYTDKNHSLPDQATRRHLYQRMVDFLNKNL